jgi:hypothetical protein
LPHLGLTGTSHIGHLPIRPRWASRFSPLLIAYFILVSHRCRKRGIARRASWDVLHQRFGPNEAEYIRLLKAFMALFVLISAPAIAQPIDGTRSAS